MCLPCAWAAWGPPFPPPTLYMGKVRRILYRDSHKCPSYLSDLWGFMEGTCLYAQRVGLKRSRPILLCLKNKGFSTVFLSAPSHTLPYGHSHGHSFQWSSSSLKLLRNSILRRREKWLCRQFFQQTHAWQLQLYFPSLATTDRRAFTLCLLCDIFVIVSFLDSRVCYASIWANSTFANKRRRPGLTTDEWSTGGDAP